MRNVAKFSLGFAGMFALLWIMSMIVIFQPTDSLPRGFYIRSFGDLGVGSIIWFKPPHNLDAFLSRSRYWSEWFSRPQNGLLKVVVGMPGSVICDSGGTFTVDGSEFGTVKYDIPGSELLPHINGCTTVGGGQVAVSSPESDFGIDSRYFGVISVSDTKTYLPLLTWSSY